MPDVRGRRSADRLGAAGGARGERKQSKQTGGRKKAGGGGHVGAPVQARRSGSARRTVMKGYGWRGREVLGGDEFQCEDCGGGIQAFPGSGVA